MRQGLWDLLGKEVPFFHCRSQQTEVRFGFKRHHCKNCGSSVCASCSPGRIKLPNVKGYGAEPHRVCTRCHRLLSQPSLYVPPDRGARSTTHQPPTASSNHAARRSPPALNLDLVSREGVDRGEEAISPAQRIVNDRLLRQARSPAGRPGSPSDRPPPYHNGWRLPPPPPPPYAP